MLSNRYRCEAERVARSTIEPGAVIAGFRIEALVGEGAMGSVYLAENAAGHRIALKVLLPEVARDERFRARFLRESQLAARLEHPSIVPVIESGEEDGQLYLAMEYVDGSDLRDVLRREGRLEPDRALALIGQVASALDAAHEAGLVHRDVKSGNVLVAGERAYICDFGLARHISSVSSLTGDRGFVGTIDYVPPEQIEGGAVDGRADLYSLGCVLYECLAGRRPFERESELSVVFAHLNEPAPPISDVRPELPRAFDDVFAIALAKAPEDRYATCGELVEAARAALSGEPLVRQSRRFRLVGTAVAVLVVAGAALGGVLATRSGTTHTAATITPTSIAGARLGLRRADYKRLLGPYRADVSTTPGFPLLFFINNDTSVYFKKLGTRAIEITTWNKAYRTAAGVGPCSSLAQVKAVYGKALQPSKYSTQHDKVFAYTLGPHVIFATNVDPKHNRRPSTTITAVAVYSGLTLDYASFVVLNEPSCS